MSADPQTLEDHRPQLTRIAYRMLGSLSDAEDIVQDAFLRFLRADTLRVDEPAAYLRTIVTRLCINRLKSARLKREVYPGPWLPEPVFDPDTDVTRDDVTFTLLLALERLSPLERAAFLLHDVFGQSYEDVGRAIGREPAACRQLAARGRRHVHKEEPRFPVDRDRGLEIASAFFHASRQGDLNRLQGLLSEDVRAMADGGGKTQASPRPYSGLKDVLELHRFLLPLFTEHPSRLLRTGFIDGLPGFASLERGNMLQATALDLREGRITGIFVTQNPDKLHALRRQLGL